MDTRNDMENMSVGTIIVRSLAYVNSFCETVWIVLLLELRMIHISKDFIYWHLYGIFLVNRM